MIWQFTIIESDTTETIISEPIGWDGIVITLNRNLKNHGIVKTIGNTDFEFVEDAFLLLKSIYDITGADSIAFLKVEYNCGDGLVLLDTFKFDFNTYKRQCGDYCFISMAANANSCLTDLMVRLSQDIDLGTSTDIDGNAITPLTELDLTLNGQDIVIRNRAEYLEPYRNTLSAQNFSAFAIGYLYHSVNLKNNILEEIPAFNFLPNYAFEINCATETIETQTDWETTIAPQFMIWERDTENISLQELCLPPDYEFQLDLRFVGEVDMVPTFDLLVSGIQVVIYAWDGTTATLVTSTTITTGTFALTNGDLTTIPFSHIVAYGPGFSTAVQLFMWFNTQYTTPDGENDDCNSINFEWRLDDTSFMQMIINTECDATVVKTFNLKDVFEFVPKALTGDCYDVVCSNDCMDDYTLTNGLRLRRKTDASNVFINWEKLFENTSKIFNLGWGISGTDFIIDKAKEFYKQTNTIDLGVVDKVVISNAKEYVYGQINVGYSKWEAEEYNGLDEMNTERKYSRKNTNIENLLDLVSQFITAGYTIEITRRKNPFSSDWRYDSDIFIINRDGSEAWQGVEDPTNITSPATRYNYRLTPIRNLLNWFNRIGFYTSPELVFNSGNGNYIASGSMTGQCDLEDGVISESQNIVVADFLDSAEAEVYFLPIIYEFSIPLTVDTFENDMIVNLYDNLYKFTCNETDFFGYLLSATFEPNQGIAEFKLLHAIVE